MPGIPCGGEKASWDANFRVCQCDQPVLEANEDSKVRECWASGTVAVQLKTGKKGKLQVKYGSVLAAAAGAGARPGPRVARTQGTALLHTGVMGASSWFLETPAWGRRGRQAALCPDNEGMGTQGSSE